MSVRLGVFGVPGNRFLSVVRRRLVVLVAGVLSLVLTVSLSGQPAFAAPPSGPSGAVAAPVGSVPVGSVPARQESVKGSPVSLKPASPVTNISGEDLDTLVRLLVTLSTFFVSVIPDSSIPLSTIS